MTVADAALIAKAVAELGVTDKGAIGALGGQKAVRLVEANGSRAVLKVIAVDHPTSATLTRAKREVELLGRIANPNVVALESPLVEIGQPVVGAAWTEEFLDGEDLGSLLGTRQWGWVETRDMGVQVANGLAAAHAEVVIHRDLSANNVRRLSNGVYKVLDFGFSRHTLLSGVTQAGEINGTPGFLTPEHLNAYNGGPMQASDVFQVGVLMYAALTGTLPIPYMGDDADYFDRLRRVACTPIATLRPDLHPQQSDIINRALHPQPARRFTGGAALRDALAATP